MAYRTPPSSTHSGSLSPSSDASTNTSPLSQTVPLTSMMTSPDESEGSVASARGTPNRHAVDLPHSQTTGKGGCWTCRLRRKKCDEQREGESCHTCNRLRIKCLGWGSKRPDWMRDKHLVEQYKADIKAQLTRAGLIRGQPRSSLVQANRGGTRTSSPARSRRQSSYLPGVAGPGPSSRSLDADVTNPEYGFQFADRPHGQHRHSMVSAMPGANNSNFHQLPLASYSDPNLNSLELGSSVSSSPFPYSPPSLPSVPLIPNPLSTPDLNFDFSLIPGVQDHSAFDFELRPPSPSAQDAPSLSGQNLVQSDCVIYYFEHVRRVQYIFAGNSVTNVTYSLIVQEPRGAVTNAVCALANLHFARMRVAQGVDPLNANPDHSAAKYFHDEAYFQLVNSKQIRGHHVESDAIAALHLVSYSLFSGGVTDWQPVLQMACDWLADTGLAVNDNPKLALSNMSATAKLAAKITLWYDTYASLTTMRPPRFLALSKRLFNRQDNFWGAPLDLDTFPQNGMRMETLSGCPDEAMLGIAEVSALAHWKATELRNGSLSYRELIRRGDALEQRLRKHQSDPPSFAEADQTPLHPNLPHSSSSVETIPPFPDEEMRRIVANIFRETVVLYLHTVLSDSSPGVPEIRISVDVIIQLLNQLPSSEVDRSLVFPICLTACMTDNSTERDFLKSRLQAQDESIGNLMQTRALMESVWQKRDVNGGAIDWREAIQERRLNLLLI